jgi:hypothetical protein
LPHAVSTALSAQKMLSAEIITRIFYDDGLGRHGCVSPKECQNKIRSFRTIVGHCHQNDGLFFPCTPSEFLAIPASDLGHSLHAVATFDLSAYADVQEVLETARTLTTKRGRVNREILRAQKQGYFVKRFEYAEYPDDVVAIHNSKPIRGNRPMRGAFYQRTSADFAAHPKSSDTRCPMHYNLQWGVFRKIRNAFDDRDHDQLVGYIGVARLGDTAWYNNIMGHGDHLHNGVMYLLHYEVVADLLKNRLAGLRYLAYYTYRRRIDDPASHWKHLALFKPAYWHYVDDRPLVIPVGSPKPDFAQGLFALKNSLSLPWPYAVQLAAPHGMSVEWLSVLHRAHVIETARAPGLVARLLQGGEYPSLDALRPLASGLFPPVPLDNVKRAVVILSGRGRGLDSLLPLHDHKIPTTVLHCDAAELWALQETYPAEWTYELCEAPVLQHVSGDFDLALIDSFPAFALGTLTHKFQGQLIIAADGGLLSSLGCDDTASLDNLAARFGDRIGAALLGRGRFFRHGPPGKQSWLWFERSQTHKCGGANSAP